MAATRTALYLSARLAAELDAARVARRAIDPPSELAGRSIGEAYDVQDAFVARREAFGAIRSGWKLGLTSDVKQRIMGIDRPVFGRTFADDRVPSGASASLADFIAPRTEPELAFGLARPLEPNVGLAELLQSVAWVAPALEITDSRYTPGKRTVVELIADNTSSAGYILGARMKIDRAPDLAAIETVILRNGVAFAIASSAGVLGNPVAALGLLARHLAERGLQTAAGDIVLSGAITDAFSVARGDRVEARLSGLGTAAVDFV